MITYRRASLENIKDVISGYDLNLSLELRKQYWWKFELGKFFDLYTFCHNFPSPDMSSSTEHHSSRKYKVWSLSSSSLSLSSLVVLYLNSHKLSIWSAILSNTFSDRLQVVMRLLRCLWMVRRASVGLICG